MPARSNHPGAAVIKVQDPKTLVEATRATVTTDEQHYYRVLFC